MPRADIEVDVDMESFGDSGAYLWGVLLSGVDIGEPQGYRAFATWRPLPDPDEARSFGEFWQWLMSVRDRARACGLTLPRVLLQRVRREPLAAVVHRPLRGQAGRAAARQVQAFIDSDAWVDLFRHRPRPFLCAHGKGLKTIAPVAGFHWRDPEASGENSMRWYRDAVGLDGEPVDLSHAGDYWNTTRTTCARHAAARMDVLGRGGEIPYVRRPVEPTAQPFAAHAPTKRNDHRSARPNAAPSAGRRPCG